MRPALLIILMDFLVSSILLFVTGAGDLQPLRPAGKSAAAPRAGGSEFSGAALTKMEEQWQQEYQENIRMVQEISQEARIREEKDKARQLAAVTLNLEEKLADQVKVIDRKEQEIKARETQLAETTRKKEELAAAQRSLEEKLAQQESQMAGQRQTLMSQQETIAELSRRHEALQRLAEKQQVMAQATDRLQKGQEKMTSKLQEVQRGVSSVKQGQAKTEAQLAEITQGQKVIAERLGQMQGSQTDMLSSLENLEKSVQELPPEMHRQTKRLLESQMQMQHQAEALRQVVERLAQNLKGAENQALAKKIEALVAQQKRLQQNMQALATPNTDSQEAGEKLQAAGKGQEAMVKGLKDLADKVEELEAKKSRYFLKFRDARVELLTLMKERNIWPKSWIKPDDVWQREIYPPALVLNNRLFLVAYYKDIGLNWSEIDGNVYEVRFILGKRGEAPFSFSLAGPIHMLDRERRIVLLYLSPQDPGEARGLSQIKPMPMIGRQNLEKRGTKQIFLFKRTLQGLSFEVEVSLDLRDDNYLTVKRQPPAPKPDRFVPEAGDFLVTAEGEMVGIMIDPERGYLLSADTLSLSGNSIPLDDIKAFAAEAGRYQRELR